MPLGHDNRKQKMNETSVFSFFLFNVPLYGHSIPCTCFKILYIYLCAITIYVLLDILIFGSESTFLEATSPATVTEYS